MKIDLWILTSLGEKQTDNACQLQREKGDNDTEVTQRTDRFTVINSKR